MTGGHLRPKVTKVGEAKTGKALMDNTAENNRTAKAEDTRINEEDAVMETTVNNDGTLGGHRPVRSAAVTRAATSIQGTTNDRTGQAGNVSLGEGGRRALEKY